MLVLMRMCRNDDNTLLRKMKGLGDTVGAMDAALRGVQNEYIHARARLCRAINPRCSALAKVPPEILAVIFEETCAANGTMGGIALGDVVLAMTCCASQLEWLALDTDDWPPPNTDAADQTVQETLMPAALQLNHLRYLHVTSK